MFIIILTNIYKLLNTIKKMNWKGLSVQVVIQLCVVHVTSVVLKCFYITGYRLGLMVKLLIVIGREINSSLRHSAMRRCTLNH